MGLTIEFVQITMCSFVYSLIIVFIQKKLIYTPEYLRQSKFASEISKKIMEAKRKGDTDTVKKLQKKYEMVIKYTTKTTIKILGLTFVLLFVFWGFLWFMGPMYSQYGTFIKIAFAIPPILGEKVDYIAWFIISSFIFIRVFSKALKMY